MAGTCMGLGRGSCPGRREWRLAILWYCSDEETRWQFEMLKVPSGMMNTKVSMLVVRSRRDARRGPGSIAQAARAYQPPAPICRDQGCVGYPTPSGPPVLASSLFEKGLHPDG